MKNTILLDKGQKIKVIGNPIKKHAVSALMKKNVMCGNIHKMNIVTNASVDRCKFDVGKISIDSTYNAICKITNTGHEKLIIYDVATSCGCTTVEYSRYPILPGQSSVLSINFKPLSKEHFSKRIFVRCNIEESPIVLEIKGDVI